MRLSLLGFLILFSIQAFSHERILQDRDANQAISGANLIRYTDHSTLPNYIRFLDKKGPSTENFLHWMRSTYRLTSEYGLKELNRIQDGLGILHIRYQQTYQQVPVVGSMLILHTKQGQVESMSGVVFEHIQYPGSGNTLTEASARGAALAKVNATLYKWQLPSEENLLKYELNDDQATYYPAGSKAILRYNNQFHLCYAFNIYAQEPLGRTLEYVDMYSGKIILSRNLIETVNVNGTAVTKFSGTQTFQTDSVSATSFRLRDASRGLGVQTFNLNHTSTYGSATDFTDADNYWNNVNANVDEAATDAHWGAQKTYDYLNAIHGRNSIDNAGYALKSYLHYNTNYVNAFWDGTRMTYGDGNISQGFLIFTALDVCGHEIGHGLVQHTADLSASSSGSQECDALNEAYADCIGTGVERLARPTTWDWKIGGDITCSTAGVPNGTGLRLMSNPTAFGDPKCYQGTNWNTSGEPHANAGPMDYWFYTEAMGNTASSITGLGYNTADSIMYRTIAVHLFPNATYTDARFYSIVSSTELYGGCSLQTITTTNAWNLCCVGGAYVPGPAVANFSADVIQTCDSTLTVNFSNTSTNANSCTWDFGDGNTSTTYTPSHTYSVGVYTVKLFVNGGSCGNDSLVHVAYIQVGPPAAPNGVGDTLCLPGIATLTATPNQPGDTIRWYANAIGGTILGTGTSFNTPSLSSTTTYYAEEKVESPIYHVGPLNNSIGTSSNYTQTTRFMVFNCSSPTVLKTVWVYASSTGNRTIILKNSGGTTIQSVTVNIPTGGSVVTLNMPIPVGTGLQLGLASTSTVNLYRNSTGAVYPYTNGPISITGNTAANSPTYYYFFYDWVLQANACISQRTPITAFVGSGTGPISAAVTPAGPVTSCSSNPVTLSATTGAGYTYQWYLNGSPIANATSSSYSAAVSGNYYVMISTSAGCQTPGTSNTVVVTIASSPSATVSPSGNQAVCQGNSLTLSANAGSGLTYQWYQGSTPINGATSQTYSASTAGTYSVVVTNTSGCTAASSAVNLSINTTPTANITPSGSQSICQGSNLPIAASTGTNYTYQWLLNNAPISAANGSTYTATAAGTYAVIVSINSACPDTSSTLTLTVNSSPSNVVNISGPTSFCTGGQVTLTATSGTGYTYQWYNGTTAIPGATSASYNATQSGSYSVHISTSNGCTSSSSPITVTVSAPPTATLTPGGTVSFCQGDSLNLLANTGSGYTYQWLNTGNIISGANGASLTVTQSGNYSVIVTAGGGCIDTSAVTTVAVNPSPTISVIPQSTTTFCTGGNVLLQADVVANYNYQWYLNGSPISGATGNSYLASAAGNHSVKVTNGNGCIATSSAITVTNLPLPQAIISCSTTTICTGDSTLIVANNGTGYTFAWYRNSTLISNATGASYYASLAGSYHVIVTDANGCSNSSNHITITVTPLPTPTIVNTNGTLSVTGGTFTSYQWYNGNTPIAGATSSTYTPTVNGDYSVQVTQNGCTAKASIHMVSVGIQTIDWSDVNISPNPCSDVIRISGVIPEEIRVLDPAGQMVARSYHQAEINVSHLAEGIYFVQLYSHQTLLMQKKIVKMN